ncbi:C6 zinc finger domain-containing protein [Paracoccidioides lutzii Pb01]|uniref:C6 zinc finger domain-containing protein n=1 Tax=Paracoccidioides lutzii (strain ATCC MYA-826 / Pb01) TaxID=502779 RepID=C1GVZ5_PARBA|nr:C6 zinc finger domain-containing protein [Paracoccidioides lutzii Pb01]EEH40714.2 C6 zinc finger domain-containing protein [Paracoccidioides lutzii Pb01]
MSFPGALPMLNTNQEPFRPSEWLLSPNSYLVQQDSRGEGQASAPVALMETGLETEFRMRQRVSLVCLPCRNRHVKCDSGLPSCSRRKFDDRQCKYMQSRRGGHNKITSRDVHSSVTKSPPKASDSNHSSLREHISGPTDNDSDSTGVMEGGTGFGNLVPLNSPILDRLLECYYSFFHEPHPMILPKQQFLERNDCRLTGNLSKLWLQSCDTLLVMWLLPVSRAFKSLSKTLLFSSELPKNGLSVQAFTLYSTAVHWNNEEVRAREILDIASRLALEIDLHPRNFAFQFVLWSVDTDVELPWEEEDFHSGMGNPNIPRPRTLLEFDDGEFDAVDVVFSSFAYLINASRILGIALAVGSDNGNPIDPAVDHANSGLISWVFHLSDVKRELVTSKGKVDPILFLAHMLIQTTTIYLHRPCSKLLCNTTENISKCAPPPLPQRLTHAAQEAYQLHTVKVLNAAEKISKLLALPTPLGEQSQFILSVCIFDANIGTGREIKELIRVNIGALKAHEKIWPLGRKTLYEVKLNAREVFTLQKIDFQSTSDSVPDPEEFSTSTTKISASGQT